MRIIETRHVGDDLLLRWTTAAPRTNVVQAAPQPASGEFTDISGPILIAGTGDITTNFIDSGATTNSNSRYYRVRVAP